MDPSQLDLTVREWVQIFQFLSFLFSSVTLSVLMVIQPRHRWYFLPLWILVQHSLLFCIAVLWVNVLNQPLGISFTDWSAVNRLHVGLTVVVYVVMLIVLRRRHAIV